MDFPLMDPAGGRKLFASELRELRRDVLKLGEFLSSTGSANNYIIQIDSNEATGIDGQKIGPTLEAGHIIFFEADKTNTGPATITIKNNAGTDLETAVPVKKNMVEELMAGDIAEGELIRLFFDGTDFQIQSVKSGVVGIAGDDIDGETLPVAVALDPADDKLLPLDLSTTATNFVGFVTSDVDEDDEVLLRVNGVVGGFTGLVPGTTYYMSDTPGVITATPPTGSGAKIVEVGVAVSDTQLFILNNNSAVGIYGANYASDTSPASTTKNATYTLNLPKKARLIQFQVCIWGAYSGAGNGSTVTTYDVIMDLVSGRVDSEVLFSRSTFNQASPGFVLSNGSIAPIPSPRSFADFSSGMFASISSGGSISRINAISQNANNQLEITYTLNHNAASSNGSAIFFSPVKVLA